MSAPICARFKRLKTRNSSGKATSMSRTPATRFLSIGTAGGGAPWVSIASRCSSSAWR
jgi:hypothetical protein